jgi:hypothetical protein
MIRLLQIEWLKLKNYKVFWILTSLYFLGIAIVGSSGMFLMEFLKRQGADFNGINPTIIPLYDFPDVWQNLTYIATFFKVILAFIVIISITNEISYRTLRQNVIEGMSKWDFLKSKLSLIFILSAIATFFLFLQGLITGLIYSNIREARFIFMELEFLAAYFLELFTFLSFALLIALVLKRAGFAIVILFMYTLIFEPILAINLEHIPQIPDQYRAIVPFLPIKALNNLIKVPFQRYVFMEIQDYIGWVETVIVIGWLIIYNFFIIWILRKRDL